MEFRPTLEVRQIAGRIRLLLGGLTYGEGATLQEAADDLVARVRCSRRRSDQVESAPPPARRLLRIPPC